MKRFEYMEEQPPTFHSSQEIVDWLNRRGRVGWELVILTDVFAIFKRETV